MSTFHERMPHPYVYDRHKGARVATQAGKQFIHSSHSLDNLQAQTHPVVYGLPVIKLGRQTEMLILFSQTSPHSQTHPVMDSRHERAHVIHIVLEGMHVPSVSL